MILDLFEKNTLQTCFESSHGLIDSALEKGSEIKSTIGELGKVNEIQNSLLFFTSLNLYGQRFGQSLA